MAKANIRFSDLSSISFNDDWKGCVNYQRVPFAQKFISMDHLTVQFAINSDAPLPVIQVIDKCTGRPFTCTITYMLDFATPETVTVEVPPGALVSLQTPVELGFALPTTHIFQSWTYFGQDITEIVVRDDIVVEGRTDIVGANLLKSSRRPRVNYAGSFPGSSFYTENYSSSNNPYQIVSGSDYDKVRRFVNSNVNGEVNSALFMRADPFVADRIYVTSFYVQKYGGTVLGASCDFIFGHKTYPIPRLFVDGVEKAVTVRPFFQTIGNHWAALNAIPANDGQPHLVEIVQTIGESPARSSFEMKPNGAQNGYGYDMWMFKMEDVTDRATADQRATAWVPHEYDPTEGGATPPIDPNQPAVIGGNTDIAENLIERYSNGTDTIYDLPIEIGREGDYEIQFSYGDAVIAKSDISVRESLCCSKLIQYNNRENDFGTIFTPGEPFCTRVEGEFRPEDDEYGVEDSDFRDQDYGLHQMSASPTAVRKLSFGGDYGAPNFIGNKVNRIFACSEVYIDGERYIRAEGAGVTKEIWSENYPKYPWKINVEKQEQGFFKVDHTIYIPSYWVDPDGTRHLFTAADTNIEELSIFGSSPVTIEGVEVNKDTIRRLVIGTDYADITELPDAFCYRFRYASLINIDNLINITEIGYNVFQSALTNNDGYVNKKLDLSKNTKITRINNGFCNSCTGLSDLNIGSLDFSIITVGKTGMFSDIPNNSTCILRGDSQAVIDAFLAKFTTQFTNWAAVINDGA